MTARAEKESVTAKKKTLIAEASAREAAAVAASVAIALLFEAHALSGCVPLPAPLSVVANAC